MIKCRSIFQCHGAYKYVAGVGGRFEFNHVVENRLLVDGSNVKTPPGGCIMGETSPTNW